MICACGGAIVPVGDAGALARAIGGVLSDRGGWKRQAEAARDRIASAYGPDVVCGRLERVYEEAIAGAK